MLAASHNVTALQLVYRLAPWGTLIDSELTGFWLKYADEILVQSVSADTDEVYPKCISQQSSS